MKKVININLGGVAFSIEENAYKVLELYLSEVGEYFTDQSEGDDIIEDIELSISEKLVAKKRGIKRVVSESDINLIISEMGEVKDFLGDDFSEQLVSKQEKKQDVHRRILYRDGDNSMLGGVASGIAEYFSIDPVIVRLLFIFLVFLNGFGILAYLILWMIVPMAETTAQKIEMKGKTPNINNIKTYVVKNIEKVPAKNIIQKMVIFPIILLDFCIKFLKKIFPILSVTIGSIILLFSCLFIFIVSTVAFTFLSGDPYFVADPVTTEFVNGFLNSHNLLLPIVCLYFVFMIPLLLCFLGAMKLIFKKVAMSMNFIMIIIMIWILLLSYTVVNLGMLSQDVIVSIKVYEQTLEQENIENTYFHIPGIQLEFDNLEIIDEDYLHVSEE